jgi:hypothetical protein
MKKEQLYIVWIEGLTPRTGEKIKAFKEDKNGVPFTEYTTKVREALRVKESDVPAFKQYLRDQEFSDWTIDSVNTFVKVHNSVLAKIWKVD